MKKQTKVAITLASSALIAGTAYKGLDVLKSLQNGAPRTNDLRIITIPAAKLALMFKQDLKDILAIAARTNDPNGSFSNSTCYDTGLKLLERMEYVCPICGHKTLHVNYTAKRWGHELNFCRRIYQELPMRESMSLDESEFCKKCSPKVTEPALNFIINFDDGTSYTLPFINSAELRILKEIMTKINIKSDINRLKLEIQSNSVKLQTPGKS